MILIGQYNSPFVRRVAIALRFYGLAFEHRPWSTFADADKIAPFNPLRRVPTLVLDGGEALIESTAILDYLDELVGPDKAMIAPQRTAAPPCAENLRAGDRTWRQGGQSRLRARAAKGSSRDLGRTLRGPDWRRAGCAGDGARAVATPFWFGERIGHADIAVACVLRFTGEAHPRLFDDARYPALAAHAARCEAMPAFMEIVQPLKPPSGD